MQGLESGCHLHLLTLQTEEHEFCHGEMFGLTKTYKHFQIIYKNLSKVYWRNAEDGLLIFFKAEISQELLDEETVSSIPC